MTNGGVLSAPSETVTLTGSGLHDDPNEYKKWSYEFSGTSTSGFWHDGTYSPVSGIEVNGAPVFKNTNTYGGVTHCIVLTPKIGSGLSSTATDGIEGDFIWIFVPWTSIVSASGYPSFPSFNEGDLNTYTHFTNSERVDVLLSLIHI